MSTTTTSRAVPSRQSSSSDSVRRTTMALLGTALGIIPLKALFSDYGWLLDVWLTMIIVIGPALILRRRRPPSALDIWPGIVLMIPWLTLRFVRENAIAGFVPGPATWHDISLLLADLHRTTRDDVAPIHTTVAVQLVICALLGLVAALIDLVAVVGHRGALAGVPLLVIYTVAGAVPRHPVSWIWFVFAAVGFLLLLGVDAQDVLDSWGRRIRPAKASRAPNTVSVTTPRIAVAAVVVAIALPLLVPAQSRNLISNAFHGGGSGGNGSGGGGISIGSIAPFSKLKGQLVRPNPVNLMTVKMEGKSTTQPFYLRTDVLTEYDDHGWTAGSSGSTTSIDSENSGGGNSPYSTVPKRSGGTSERLTARISLDDVVGGNAPVFAVPTSITGLSDDTTWSPKDQVLGGKQIGGATQYTETFQQPEPTAAQLAAAGDSISDPQVAPYLTTPDVLPTYVRNLVTRLTRGRATLYAKALALNNYFTNPSSGFIYSLQTKVGNSGSELEDFLRNKQGYCEQYAAAEAIMLRAAGVPSRVVLGYMHAPTDDTGTFTVSTSDAHSWVEAYFPGQGWIPFDPTPSSGLAGGSKTDLPWARHRDLTSTSTAGPQPTISRSQSPAASSSAPTSSPAKVGANPTSRSMPVSLTGLWWGLGVLALVVLALVPAGVRWWRRRSRLTAARRAGDADLLWAELSDTAVDLGYVWSSARTPRQVASWLSRDIPAASAGLATLADAVERERYAPTGRGATGTATVEDLRDDLRAVTDEMRAGRTRSSRLRAALYPASLGWGRFGSGRRSRD